jgi:hypothetical protein
VAITSPSNSSCSVDRDGAGGHVEAGRAPPESQIEVEIVVRLFAQRDLLRLPLACEQLLGQRRPVVRQMALVAQHHQRAVVALVAQGLGGAKSGERGADDHDRAQRGHDAGTLQRVGN